MNASGEPALERVVPKAQKTCVTEVKSLGVTVNRSGWIIVSMLSIFFLAIALVDVNFCGGDERQVKRDLPVSPVPPNTIAVSVFIVWSIITYIDCRGS